jgi:hypothetical protein
MHDAREDPSEMGEEEESPTEGGHLRHAVLAVSQASRDGVVVNHTA